MTKAEAIKILDWIPTKGDEVDAMEMAIEALSIDIVRCKDCVHRVWCCRNIRSEGRRQDDYCSFGERGEQDDES